MKKIILFVFAVIVSATGGLAASRTIAFERNNSVWIANLDGTREKKIADGIFPAISPDRTRVAFATVEKSDTRYVRHIAVVEIVTGNTTTFENVPSDNVYYPQWSPDGKRILFTLRQNEVWNLATIAPDGTDFHILKKGAQDQATLYSPCWARDEGSIFCQDMTNIYQVSLDGSILGQWEIERIIPNGGMSGDGRIAVSPDSKRLLLSVDMGEIGTVRRQPCGYLKSRRKKLCASHRQQFSVGTVVGSTTIRFCSCANRRARNQLRFIACRSTEKI